MSSFVLEKVCIDQVNKVVSESAGSSRYSYQLDSTAACAAVGDCGCGVGGTCANSCVSGCADRGNCCSYGSK